MTKGADVNARDKQGTTALMAAAFGGHVPTGRLLLDRKADVNMADVSGRTALMATALGGDVGMGQALLGAKAILSDRNPEIDLACRPRCRHRSRR